MRSDLPQPVGDLPSSDLPASDSPQGDLTVDCDRCMVRGDACGECIVTVLLGPIGGFSSEERTAFAVLADSGLVPRLRLVTPEEGVA